MGIGGPYYRYMVVDPYNNASSTARCFGVSTSTSNKANRSTNISVRYFYNGTVYNSESDARTACKRQASWSGTVYVIYRKSIRYHLMQMEGLVLHHQKMCMQELVLIYQRQNQVEQAILF